MVPPGFVPTQDKQYLVSFAQLPDGATLDRTEKVIRQMSDIALKEPGVESAVAFPGLSINGFINSPSAGIVFVTLKPFEERTSLRSVGHRDRAKAAAKYCRHQGRAHRDLSAAAGAGPGHRSAASSCRSKTAPTRAYEALDKAMKTVQVQGGRRTRRWPASSPAYNIGVPQLYADLDRTKAMQLGVDVQDVFDTMQIYLGSLYVNDFNNFGRTYEVIAQADTPFRSKPDDILQLQTRNLAGRWCRWAR